MLTSILTLNIDNLFFSKMLTFSLLKVYNNIDIDIIHYIFDYRFVKEKVIRWNIDHLLTFYVYTFIIHWQVLHQVHPSLIAKEDALEYIESLIISLLGTLCACQPHSVQDVTERVNKTFPDPIDKWANRDANTALEKGKKNSNIVLPVDKIHQALVKVYKSYSWTMETRTWYLEYHGYVKKWCRLN